ncbi:MAG: DUF3644 domain-containing protein [Heliobacteriaceae bacterium]|nr:DUF3644 domain-containing protein [Heliobacteriaceae bacterium]
MAIEIYNKPTIRYRVEGFAFFICNAWELMLKSHLIKKFGEESIYYKDNKDRTISLENCIEKVFTNNKDPLRMNLEKIIELRNTSTHFITEEYEMVYVPLFQSCIFNFSEKMQKFHEVDVTELISLNFLNLVIKENALDENEIKAKYSDKIADKLLGLSSKISKIAEENNSNFSIRIEHHYYLTKDKDKATDVVAIDKNAKNPIQIVKEVKDVNETHKYTMKKLITEVNKQLARNNVVLRYETGNVKFNSHYFQLFCKYYGMKENPKWCYVHKQFSMPQYTYSLQAVEFIVEELKKDPSNILSNIKQNLKNRSTPGAKEF